MEGETRFTTRSESADTATGKQAPVQVWGDVLLAALPFVLILVFDVLPKLLVESGLLTWEAPAMQRLNIILRDILLIGAVLLFLFLTWRRKWPAGLATWYPFFVLAPLFLAGALLSALQKKSPNFVLSQGITLYVVIPFVLAVLLYMVARRNPLTGLLAALPMLYILWMVYNMEFVPDRIEVTVKLLSSTLIILAIAFLLRRGDWRIGLYVVLSANLVVGVLFSYAGIYYGGTLPHSAPGPNPVEVLRSLIPQYLATSAILLGPLFAWQFRQAGRGGGQSGRIGYHLALAGLLVVILSNLASLAMTMDSATGRSLASGSAFMAAIVVGLGAYLLGVFWLNREAPPIEGLAALAHRVLLALLPLGMPITFMLPFITWKWPVSSLYGVPLLWELPHALSLSLGLVWLALSVWVVTRQGAFQEPAVPGVTIPSTISS